MGIASRAIECQNSSARLYHRYYHHAEDRTTSHSPRRGRRAGAGRARRALRRGVRARDERDRAGAPASTRARCRGCSRRWPAPGWSSTSPATGRYRLGLRLLQLGNTVLARLDLREVARPHLQALVAKTGETATLSAPGEVRCDHRRFRPERGVGAERGAGGAAERRARHGDREGAARVRLCRAPRRAR